MLILVSNLREQQRTAVGAWSNFQDRVNDWLPEGQLQPNRRPRGPSRPFIIATRPPPSNAVLQACGDARQRVARKWEGNAAPVAECGNQMHF